MSSQCYIFALGVFINKYLFRPLLFTCPHILYPHLNSVLFGFALILQGVHFFFGQSGSPELPAPQMIPWVRTGLVPKFTPADQMPSLSYSFYGQLSSLSFSPFSL